MERPTSQMPCMRWAGGQTSQKNESVPVIQDTKSKVREIEPAASQALAKGGTWPLVQRFGRLGTGHQQVCADQGLKTTAESGVKLKTQNQADGAQHGGTYTGNKSTGRSIIDPWGSAIPIMSHTLREDGRQASVAWGGRQ